MKRIVCWILLAVSFSILSAGFLSAQEPTILVGLHAGVPTKASIGIGTGKSIGEGKLAFMMFEPGIAGGRVSAGIANMKLHPAVLLKATWLRTWGTPVNAVSDRNYVGPELQLFGKHGLGVRGGVLFPASRSAGTVTSLGVSFGF